MRSDDEMKARMGAKVGEHVARRVAKIVAMVVGGVFVAVLFGFLFGWVLQLLWNATVASMFDWPQITYWEAVGLFLLAKLLFGFGFGGRGGGHGHGRDHKHDQRAEKFWQRGLGMTGQDVPASEMFRDYWREEGKAAYDAYLARQGKDEPPNQ